MQRCLLCFLYVGSNESQDSVDSKDVVLVESHICESVLCLTSLEDKIISIIIDKPCNESIVLAIDDTDFTIDDLSILMDLLECKNIIWV